LIAEAIATAVKREPGELANSPSLIGGKNHLDLSPCELVVLIYQNSQLQ
jgi:hypothetical protein